MHGSWVLSNPVTYAVSYLLFFKMHCCPLCTDHKCSSTVDIYKIYVSQRKPVLDTLMQDSLLDYEKPTSYSVYSFGYPVVCSMYVVVCTIVIAVISQ